MKRQMFVLIKGTESDAHNQLELRRIHLINNLGHNPKWDETSMIVESDEDTLNRWFTESTQAPHPPGTLLLWNYKKED